MPANPPRHRYPLRPERRRGITLIETIVGIAVFVVIAGGLYSTYVQLAKLAKAARVRTTATAVAKQYMEIVRNLPYADVGVVSGVPSGTLPVTQNVTQDNTTFVVRYTIRNVDDEFDGTLGGSPNDLSPADYKLATVEVTCSTCQIPGTLASVTTHVTPKNLEIASDNGALFIQVFDANGQPVPQANVHVENSTLIPSVAIDDVTNNDGLLAIIDVPPAEESYRIVVTKSGYSTDRTYGPSDPVVINPLKLDATVLLQQVTQISFFIDRVSTLNINSVTATCAPVANVDFTLVGSKLISRDPDVYKYDQDLSTDANGLRTLTNMEWDTYMPTITDSSYELRGTVPLIPLSLAPNTTQDLRFVMETASPHSFLVVVRDASTQLPLSDAAVHLTKSGYDQTLFTSRGYFRQTNWKDGSGQASFVDQEKYWSDDGNVSVNQPVGQLKLRKPTSRYVSSGWLVSSTFDTGATTNFVSVEWQPGDQPAQCGANPVRFQIATNNDNATWNFVGPDGTASTYYTTPGQPISSVHNGTRYLRYKVYLSTANTYYTPNIAEVAVTYVSTCVPPGQAFFNGLTSSTYTLTVSLAGYQTSVTYPDLSPDWSMTDISLLPE